MNERKHILYLVAIILLLNSCKKYSDDNSFIHLETVKCRLAGGDLGGVKGWNQVGNQWVGIAFYRNGDFTGGCAPFYITTGKRGKWQLIDKKEKLKITDDAGVSSEYIIMRLDNNSLLLKKDSTLFAFNKQGK